LRGETLPTTGADESSKNDDSPVSLTPTVATTTRMPNRSGASDRWPSHVRVRRLPLPPTNCLPVPTPNPSTKAVATLWQMTLRAVYSGLIPMRR
jgi:hypothetical protein